MPTFIYVPLNFHEAAVVLTSMAPCLIGLGVRVAKRHSSNRVVARGEEAPIFAPVGGGHIVRDLVYHYHRILHTLAAGSVPDNTSHPMVDRLHVAQHGLPVVAPLLWPGVNIFV